MGLGELEIAGTVVKGQFAAFIIATFCLLVFLSEIQKYFKYKTRGDALELSGIAIVFFGALGLSEDFLLAILISLFVMMCLGTWEVRENTIWLRLMSSFTITYGFILIMYLSSLIFEDEKIFGIGWNLSLWVLLISSFLFFGRRFILVSRFLSPAYVYLFMYGLAYLALLQAGLDWEFRYLLLFIINMFIYLISGPILRILFGIKTLEDERVTKILEQVQKDIKTPIKHIGIVNAPILNAFAYGAWFDQRIAFIASDISKYSDEEIAGIAAHELAHLKGKHTLLLLVVSFVDLAFRFLTDIPASYYDYAFREQSLGFVQYYFINFALGIIALLFVRILEGNADLRANKAGYGPQLAASLYRLEGYYRGVAGDLGLSTQLLTGKERSEFEENRFMGDAALDLHQVLIDAPRYRLIFNIIMSHPLSAFRIAAILDQKISPLKGAVLPWLLLIPKVRGRLLKQLRSNEKGFSTLLTEKYLKGRDSITTYTNLTPEVHWYNKWKGKTIYYRPRNSKGSFNFGTLEEVVSGELITDPINFSLKTTETSDTKVISVTHNEFYFLSLGSEYFLKDGKKVVLKDFLVTKKGKLRFHYESMGKDIHKKYLGINIEDLPRNGEKLLLFSRGVIELATIKTFDCNNGFKTGKIELESNNNDKNVFNGRDFIVSRPLNYIIISGRKKWNQQKEIFDWLCREEIPLTLFDKDDLEIGRHCYVHNLDDQFLELQVLGNNKVQRLNSERIDAIIPRTPIFLFYIRQELGFGTRIGMRLANRGIKPQFIL